ncbi:MAG: hypothetical protein ACKV2V_21160, partial [Blastocatellia bacterium]
MSLQTIRGTLFDLDECGNSEIFLWVITTTGLQRLWHPFRYCVYVAGVRDELIRLSQELHSEGMISSVAWRERTELYSGALLNVLELHVRDYAALPRLRQRAEALRRRITFYNLDLSPAQYYFYHTGLFPLCEFEARVNAAGVVQQVRALSSPWDCDYRVPAFRVMKLHGELLRPLRDRSRIILECAGQKLSLRYGDGAAVITAFNQFVSTHDPDLIQSFLGDAIIFPALLALARKHKLELKPDRDGLPTRRRIITEGRSFFSYGQILYKDPAYPLHGRWHIDLKNSVTVGTSGLEGVIELARVGRLPVQRAARSSPGTAMTSMQMCQAVQDGILIPWQKSRPETWKTALELLTVDK